MDRTGIALTITACVVILFVALCLIDAFWLHIVFGNDDSGRTVQISSSRIASNRSWGMYRTQIDLVNDCKTGDAMTGAMVTSLLETKFASSEEDARNLTYCDVSQIKDGFNFVGAMEYVGEIVENERLLAVLFEPRGANDITVKLDDIEGEMYSMFIVHKDHAWQEGFTGGQNGTKAAMDATAAAQDAALLLVGDKAIHDVKDHKEPPFNFTASGSTTFKMKQVETSVSLAHLNAQKRKKGALHMALDNVTYAFKLANKTFKVRVLLSRVGKRGALMGVKQVWVNDKWMFLDKDSDELTTTEPLTPWSFWNQHDMTSILLGLQQAIQTLQQTLLTGPEEEQAELQQLIAQQEAQMAAVQAQMTAMVEQQMAVLGMYGAKRRGMPVEVVGEVDFEKFKTHNVALDILTSGHVGFRNAKIETNSHFYPGEVVHPALTEASLAANPKYILKLFDIDDLSLKAQFTFTEAS